VGRRSGAGPTDPQAEVAYLAWREHWETQFRMRGYREDAVQRKVAGLLTSHVAWDRGPGPVSQHALAIGAVDPGRVAELRARIEPRNG